MRGVCAARERTPLVNGNGAGLVGARVMTTDLVEREGFWMLGDPVLAWWRRHSDEIDSVLRLLKALEDSSERELSARDALRVRKMLQHLDTEAVRDTAEDANS